MAWCLAYWRSSHGLIETAHRTEPKGFHFENKHKLQNGSPHNARRVQPNRADHSRVPPKRNPFHSAWRAMWMRPNCSLYIIWLEKLSEKDDPFHLFFVIHVVSLNDDAVRRIAERIITDLNDIHILIVFCAHCHILTSWQSLINYLFTYSMVQNIIW
jgi:hypothetical protein